MRKVQIDFQAFRQQKQRHLEQGAFVFVSQRKVGFERAEKATLR